MTETIDLRLGKLTEGDTEILHSGFRWVREAGQSFEAGDVLGHCFIWIPGAGGQRRADAIRLEAQEWDIQVALIANIPGRLKPLAGSSRGGFHDRRETYRWNPATVVARIEPAPGVSLTGGEGPIRYHFIAGRRASELAENRSGLLTGWHDRSRAWRQGAGGPMGSVLALGICELSEIVRGEQGVFLEMLASARGAVHVIDVPDRPLVHSARIIVEQIGRSEADRNALAKEFAKAISDDPAGTSPADWTFAALSLQALMRSPPADRYDVLTRTGLETVGPADAVVLSINAEAPARLRHRKLGFHFDCHTYRLNRAGPGLLNWFKTHFEWVDYSIDDIRRDYLEMARLLRQACPQRQILVLNTMTTVVGEDILSYDGFDQPLGRQLKTVRSRELNGMLHDIAREADIAIVDADAIGAELGISANIPDGIHQSGPMQAELRAEILSILAGRGVPGFAPERVTESRSLSADARHSQPIAAMAHPLNR